MPQPTTYRSLEEEIESERQLIRIRWEKFKLTGQTLRHEEVSRWVASLTPYRNM